MPSARAFVLSSTAAITGGWVVKHRCSKAVQMWRASTLPTRLAGPLHVRTAGTGNTVTVLLHGLVATGDIFGATFDRLAERTTLVVPDLLGFGRSLDETREQFTAEDHLDALDAALEDLGLADRPLIVGAHSMGSALAVRWLERHQGQITSIVCFGPPVYRDSDAVDKTISSSGLMARAFVSNTRWAELACQLNCSHRTFAGILAAVVTPELPKQIAKAASRHTWPAYRDAMEKLVARTDWVGLTDLASDLHVPVTMVWGSKDRIGDRSYASGLRGVKLLEILDAGHHLPLTHGSFCVEHLSQQ